MHTSQFMLAAVVDESEASMWQVILGLFPRIQPVESDLGERLCRDGVWISGAEHSLRAAGLRDRPSRRRVIAVVGPRGALRAAIREAQASHVPAAVVAFHRARR